MDSSANRWGGMVRAKRASTVATTTGALPAAIWCSAAKRLRSHSREETALGRNCHSLASSVTGICTGQALQVPRQLAGLPLVGTEKHHGPSGSGGHRRADAGPLHRLGAGEDSGASAVFHPAHQLSHLRQRL